MKRSIAESVRDRASVHTRTRGRGGALPLPYEAIWDVPFFRVSFVSINS